MLTYASIVELHLSGPFRKQIVRVIGVHITGVHRFSLLPMIFRSDYRGSRSDKWIQLVGVQLILIEFRANQGSSDKQSCNITDKVTL